MLQPRRVAVGEISLVDRRPPWPFILGVPAFIAGEERDDERGHPLNGGWPIVATGPIDHVFPRGRR